MLLHLKQSRDFWFIILYWFLFLKQCFVCTCIDISTFVQSRDPEEYSDVKSVQYLPDEFTVCEEWFKKIPPHSVVVLDDFSLRHTNKMSKLNFLRVVNYNLRHFDITLFLLIHNLLNVGLFTEIMLSPHLIISYTNLGSFILRY